MEQIMGETSPTNRSATASDLALRARQAGLRLTDDEAARLVEPYERTQAALGRLRAVLDPVEEPANIFHAVVVEGQ
jgi:hypothetical protein